VSIDSNVLRIAQETDRHGVPDGCRPTPWDGAVLGMPSFEIVDPSPERLAVILDRPGHYTVKVDPLQDTRSLAESGFYYCDTLLEPWCERVRFTPFPHRSAQIILCPPKDVMLRLCHGAFRHGRFHRDFNISQSRADERYDNWLLQLHGSHKVFGLAWESEVVGFFASEGPKAVLHAIAPKMRGRGIAKHLWTAAIVRMFEEGHSVVTSSVSAANVAVINLYAALNFRFRSPVDVYHRIVRSTARGVGTDFASAQHKFSE
jgi:RimJ/RimL family protein N-acetyltransferase